MTRLVLNELFKLRTTRMYVGLLAAATGLVVVVTAFQFLLGPDASLRIDGAAEVITSEADLRSVLDVSGVAALFTLILGATAVSGEVRHRTIAGAFLLTPRRGRLVAAKVVAYSIAGALFGVVVSAAAAAVAFGWLAAGGIAIPLGASVAAGLALTPLSTGLAAGFGVGISAIVPNQLGSVLVAIGWVMMVEQLVSGLVPGVARWLPFSGAGAAITGLHPDLGAAGGVALFVLYVMVVAWVGIRLTARRDVV